MSIVLLKGNYRPVSILPTISKNFERAIDEQLVTFFDLHFNLYLSAFRSGYSCQDTLIRIIEDWKNLLDNNQYVTAILMDLSKAFDCLPHNLLLLKLENYGVSENSLKLLQSYLTGRKQCVKIGSVCSSFLDIYKGVPHRSILGPVMFNIFINDIFDFVKKGDLHNLTEATVLMMLLKLLKNRVLYLLSGLLKITCRLILINCRPFQLVGKHMRKI